MLSQTVLKDKQKKKKKSLNELDQKGEMRQKWAHCKICLENLKKKEALVDMSKKKQQKGEDISNNILLPR